MTLNPPFLLIWSTTMIDQHQAVKDAVVTVVESGTDVHQKIKAITLKALTSRQLDLENIKSVTDAVGKGINDGMATHGEHAKEVFTQAATALDDALAIAAQASKLAIE
jgi:hypothetical protein